MKLHILALLLVLVPAALADSKVKTKTSMEGHAFESTSYIKGQRFRNENSFALMGASLSSIRQCDMKRTIEINDKNKTYLIVPDREPGSSPAPAPQPETRSEPERNEPTRHGGTVTITTDVKDTGERKDMFGYKARHVIASMKTQSSPDACEPNQGGSMQIDGWYIDFNPGQQSCVKPEQQVLDMLKPGAAMPAMPTRSNRGGCEDDIKFQGSGFASFTKLGFPVNTVMTMTDKNGKTATMTREAEEVSTAPLDAALFDVPAGYKEVNSMTALMGITAGGIAGALARGAVRNQTGIGSSATSAPSGPTPTTGQVCVNPVQDSSGRWSDTSTFQQRAIGSLQGSGVQAIPAGGTCKYTLSMSITNVKDPSAAKKLGGLLGHRLPVGGGSAESEASVSYNLTKSDGSPVANGTADGKGQNADEAVAAALNKAAQQAGSKAQQ